MSHDVAVMRGGKFVEYGTRRQLFENPTQNYTQALMQAVLIPIPRPEGTADRDTYNEKTNDFSWRKTNIQ
jgi:ABC-type oligopeptide transport system ATPase subunit